MSEKRLKGLAALGGLALLAAITSGALFGSQAAADDLQAHAQRALAAADLDGVHVAFRGREAELSGGTADELGQAELVVEGIEGVRWADVVQPASGAPTPARPDTTPTLHLSRTAGGIRISGTVPDPDAAAVIKARAAEVFGVPVTGDLVIDAAVGPASWVSQLPAVFVDVVGVKGLELTIDGTGTLDLAGSIESEAGADEIRRLASAAVPDLDVVGHLDVRPGGLSEADAAVLNSSSLRFGPGSSGLDAGDSGELDVIAGVLQRNARISVEVWGHAGPQDPAEGERLSIARVEAVEAYLVRAGVDTHRISTRILASDSRTGTKPSDQQYRRVDFVVKEM